MVVQCIACGQYMEMPAGMSDGQHIECPTCGEKLSVYSDGSMRLLVTCPSCGKGIELPESDDSSSFTCPHCGVVIEAEKEGATEPSQKNLSKQRGSAEVGLRSSSTISRSSIKRHLVIAAGVAIIAVLAVVGYVAFHDPVESLVSSAEYKGEEGDCKEIKYRESRIVARTLLCAIDRNLGGLIWKCNRQHLKSAAYDGVSEIESITVNKAGMTYSLTLHLSCGHDQEIDCFWSGSQHELVDREYLPVILDNELLEDRTL